MRIISVPCLKDNYAYLIICEKTGKVAVVDASEDAPVRAALGEAGVVPNAIWTTHHHFDHVGGNESLKASFPLDVLGHESDRGRIPGQTVFLATGARFAFGEVSVEILHIPGHTLGAIAYVLRDGNNAPAVFTGDTLFLGGCGRLFEGTPAQMHHSLTQLKALPGETRVYVGHEYTQSNLAFAKHVEPSNRAVHLALEEANRARAAGRPTVPGTLTRELQTNPFLRVGSEEIRKSLGVLATAPDEDAFAALRRAKDTFA